MATIRKRGDSWQAQVRHKGKTVSRSFIKKADAQRWASQTETEADRRGLPHDRRDLDRLKVADILIRFRETLVPQRRGKVVETFVINAFLRNDLAQVRLGDVTAEGFAAYRDERLKCVRPGTINRELGLIQHIFEVARTDWGIPVTNPIKGLRKPKADRARDRRLHKGEWASLIEALKRVRNPLISPLVSFAIETGMRRGELLNSRWKDLNWQLGTLNIPVTKTGDTRQDDAP